MKVKSVMVPHSSITIDSSWTLAEVDKFFKSMGTDYLTIANNGKTTSVLSREGFRKVLKRRDLGPDMLTKVSVMAIIEPDDHYCEPEHCLAEVYHRMVKGGLKHLAVKSSEKIIGVISFSTVAAAVMSCMGEPTGKAL